MVPRLTLGAVLLLSCQRGAGDSPEPRAEPSVAEQVARSVPTTPMPRTAGWLGMRMEGDGARGMIVREVVSGTVAERAGIRVGDVIVTIDTVTTQTPADVDDALRVKEVGEPFDLAFQRGEHRHLVRVALEPMPTPDELLRLRFLDRPLPPLDSLEAVTGARGAVRGWLGRRATVVEFWASWCGTCQALSGTLNDWQVRFEPRGVRVVGVTREAREVALPAAERWIRYEVALDREGKLSEALDVRSLPLVFVVDAEGTVRDVMRGMEPQGIRRIEALLGDLSGG